MASIKGFQMKSVKQPLGREGYGCVGTMYLHGKKIGTYADYGDGSIVADVRYISKEAEIEMQKIIIEYAKDHPNEYIVNLYKERPQQYEEEVARFKKLYPYISEEDITMNTMSGNTIEHFVGDYINIYNLEKDFKKHLKKGYRAMGVNKNSACHYPAEWTDEKINKHATEEGMTLYKSLDDFCI